MCSKPKIPKQPKVAAVVAPPIAKETASRVGTAQPDTPESAEGKTTIGRFDLRIPSSFQLPRR